jgi:hypothetical protein
MEKKEKKNIWYWIGQIVGLILLAMGYAISFLFLGWLIKLLWTHIF